MFSVRFKKKDGSISASSFAVKYRIKIIYHSFLKKPLLIKFILNITISTRNNRVATHQNVDEIRRADLCHFGNNLNCTLLCVRKHYGDEYFDTTEIKT